MNRDREALLPCPFCQGAAEVIERENPMSKWRWSVDCASSQCGMSGPVTASKPDAISAWNVRALSPTTLGGGSGSAQDGLPPARSHPSEPQAPSGDGWLPIESAPRDGTQFLALLSNGWFDLLRAPPEYSGPWPDGRAYLCWQGRNNPPIVETYSPDTVATTSIRATHWMPLPAPPSKASRHPVASDGEAKRPNTNNTQGEES